MFPFIIDLKDKSCDERVCNFYAGHILTSGKIRSDPNHKWFDNKMSDSYKELYKKIPHYWPYADGGFYILSNGLVKVLNYLKDDLAVFKNEDAMVGSWVVGLRKQIIHIGRNGPIFFHPVKSLVERKGLYAPQSNIFLNLRFNNLNHSVCF
jgi:hypothetical protein